MNHRWPLAFYLALILLQVTWHFALPPPFGFRNWILAAIAVIPLLLPLKGVIAGRFRSLTWGGFLAVLYFVIGVMEAWSNPSQRIAACLQAGLALGYCVLLAAYARNQADR